MKKQRGFFRKSILGFMGFILLIAIILTTIFGFYYAKLTRPLPGNIKVSHLSGPVEITESHFGVPTIHATRQDLDAFYGQGFQHAKDRLWQMELQRRAAKGTLSELFGKLTVDKDRFYRTLGIYPAAEKAWAHISPEGKAILKAYSDGVNAFIEQNQLPIHYRLVGAKPEPWTPIDSLAWQKMMAWSLNQMWIEKLKTQELLQDYGHDALATFWPDPPHETTILSSAEVREAGLPTQKNVYHLTQHFDHSLELELNEIQAWHDNQPGKGSNNWVISGKRTQSGKPILASDPHLKLTQPGPWYMVKLEGPTMSMAGASLVGLPGIMIGHNQHIAWGVTNVEPNVQDLFIETDPEVLTTIDEIIYVKGGENIHFTRRKSPRGPIISDVLDGQINYPLSLRWVGFDDDDTTADSLFTLNRAKNWDDFVAAVEKFVVPALNVVYGDVYGNIGYYMTGRIPLRKDNLNPTPVIPTPETEWSGYIPFNELPHIYNPESGYIATANNKVVPDEYAYNINYLWKETHYRSQRIRDLIESVEKHNIQSSVEIQQDTLSYLWSALKPSLCNIQVPQHQDIHEQFCQWDGDMHANRHEPAFFALWLQRLKQMFPKFNNNNKPAANASQYFIQEQLISDGAYCRAETESCNGFLQTTYMDAIEEYLEKKGDHGVTWGGLHQVTFTDPVLEKLPFVKRFIRRTIATPGGHDTVNVGAYRDKFNHHHGAGYRQVIDLNDLDQTLMIQVMGQSQYPWTDHYDDLLQPWATKQYLQVHQMQAETKITLMPS